MTREFLTKLRKLGENHYGNKLYGEHLQYQHELQDLTERYIAEKVLEARIEELREHPDYNGSTPDNYWMTRLGILQAELSKLKEEESE